MGFIYRITNKENQKAYVGMTSGTVEKRWRGHVRKALRGDTDMLICKAIRKYGEESFHVETLEQCENSLLKQAEQRWISVLGTFESGYNLTKGGEGTFGFKFSDKSRQKMSEKAKLRGVSRDVIEKVAAKNRRRKLSQEVLARRGPRGKYKGLSAKTRQRMSEAHAGKPRPDSFIRSISRPVEQLNESGDVIAMFSSLKEAAAHFSVSHTTIRGYITGRIKNSRYRLRYAERST